MELKSTTDFPHGQLPKFRTTDSERTHYRIPKFRTAWHRKGVSVDDFPLGEALPPDTVFAPDSFISVGTKVVNVQAAQK